MTRFAVPVFPGSNCDRDCMHVLQEVLGAPAEFVWHMQDALNDFDAVIVPGGFSYGDYLRTGAVAKLSPVMGAIARFAERGGPVLGICNGFQVLLEAGLLPGAMLRNTSLHFRCEMVTLRCATDRTPFTRRVPIDTLLRVPIAHAEGNYFVDDAQLGALRDRDQIVFEYVTPQGQAAVVANPNGSVANIAGVCNERGNVVGMMPHPERASEAILGSSDGLALFQSALDALSAA